MTKKITKVIVCFDDGTFEEMHDQKAIKPMGPVIAPPPQPPPVYPPQRPTAPRWPNDPNDRQYWWTGPYVTWGTAIDAVANKYSFTAESTAKCGSTEAKSSTKI